MEEYRYFVAFVSKNRDSGYRPGRRRLNRTSPIRSMADVRAIEEFIQKKIKRDQVRVVSWQFFESGPNEAGVTVG